MVERWWATLTETEQRELSELWDSRREEHFFTPQSAFIDLPDAWENLPTVTGGRFVPHDDSARMADWIDDWLEYLSGHEEVVLLSRAVVVFRTYHMCQIEPAARAVTACGLLPASFCCPVARPTCPMQRVQAIAPNQSFHLAPAAAGGWWVIAPGVRTRN